MLLANNVYKKCIFLLKNVCILMMHVFLENQDKSIMNFDEIFKLKVNKNILFLLQCDVNFRMYHYICNIFQY